jgi:hypothetical protein
VVGALAVGPVADFEKLTVNPPATPRLACDRLSRRVKAANVLAQNIYQQETSMGRSVTSKVQS